MSHANNLMAPNVFGSQPILLQQINAQRGFSSKSAKSAATLGSLQLAAGFLAIIFQITAMVVSDFNIVKRNYNIADHFGAGIWCGAMFMLTGLLGVLAGKKNKRILIVSFLVLNIIMSLLTWALVGLSVTSLIFSPNDIKAQCLFTYYGANRGGKTVQESRICLQHHQSYSIHLAMYCLLFILAIFEFFAAITSAAYCCGALKCCSEDTRVFVLQQRTPAPANAFEDGPSVQPVVGQQGNFVMMTGPNGYPTGAPFAHMHVPSAQGIRPSNTAFRAYSSSAYYSSADTTAYDEATYSTLAPYDYVVPAK